MAIVLRLAIRWWLFARTVGPRRFEGSSNVAAEVGQHAGQCLLFRAASRSPCLREEVAMDVLHERCAGLDVHQETVVCCVLISEPGGRCRKEFRTFGTMTADLEALRDWLRARPEIIFRLRNPFGNKAANSD